MPKDLSLLLGKFAALGAAFCWAVAPILYRQALFSTNPISANIVRCVSNAGVMFLFLVALGGWDALASLPLDSVVFVVASGVVGLGIADTLYMRGLHLVGVSIAVPLASTYPLFNLIWATFLLGEPLTATAVLGAVVILVGIWLLSREKTSLKAKYKKGKWMLTGAAASLATALVWSVSVALMDVAIGAVGAGGVDVNFAMVTVRVASVAGFLLLFSPLLDKNRGFLKMKRKTVIQLCIGGLVANAVGWFLMNYSFLSLPEAQAVPISSTTPLFSALAGFLLFQEKATLKRIAGAATVVAGIILIFIV